MSSSNSLASATDYIKKVFFERSETELDCLLTDEKTVKSRPGSLSVKQIKTMAFEVLVSLTDLVSCHVEAFVAVCACFVTIPNGSLLNSVIDTLKSLHRNILTKNDLNVLKSDGSVDVEQFKKIQNEIIDQLNEKFPNKFADLALILDSYSKSSSEIRKNLSVLFFVYHVANTLRSEAVLFVGEPFILEYLELQEKRLKDPSFTFKQTAIENILELCFSKDENSILPDDLRYRYIIFQAFEILGFINDAEIALIILKDFNFHCLESLESSEESQLNTVHRDLQRLNKEINEYISTLAPSFIDSDLFAKVATLWNEIKGNLEVSEESLSRLDQKFEEFVSVKETIKAREDDNLLMITKIWLILDKMALSDYFQTYSSCIDASFVLEYVVFQLDLLFNLDLKDLIRSNLLQLASSNSLDRFSEWEETKKLAFELMMAQKYFIFSRSILEAVCSCGTSLIKIPDQICLWKLKESLVLLSNQKHENFKNGLKSLDLEKKDSKETFFNSFKVLKESISSSLLQRVATEDPYSSRWEQIQQFFEKFTFDSQEFIFSVDCFSLYDILSEAACLTEDVCRNREFVGFVLQSIEKAIDVINKTFERVALELCFDSSLSSIGDMILCNFINFIDESWKKFRNEGHYYAPIISTAQSSGAGKSKLCYEMLRRRPGFYVNFNEASSTGIYPNRSDWAGLFETMMSFPNVKHSFAQMDSEKSIAGQSIEGKFLIFLHGLICSYFAALNDYKRGICLSEKSPATNSNSNTYAIAALSCSFHQKSNWKDKIQKSHQLNELSIQDVVRKLNDLIETNMASFGFKGFPFVLVFDEATNLLLKFTGMVPYFDIVRHAMHFLSTQSSLILITVATNSNVFDLNRPPRLDSLRVRERTNGLAPYILTGNWDAFAPNCYKSVTISETSLTDGTLVKHLISMGRPMWASISFDNLVSTARGKIQNGSHRDDIIPHLALWAIRTGLGFCPYSVVKRTLIKSHMASLFYVTPDLSDLEIDYPSEPVLAIAARGMLSDSNDFVTTFKNLYASVTNLYVDRGRLAECIVSQLILQAIADRVELKNDFDLTTSQDMMKLTIGSSRIIGELNLVEVLNKHCLNIEDVPRAFLVPCSSDFSKFCKVLPFLERLFDGMVVNWTHLSKVVKAIPGQNWSILDGIVNATHFIPLDRASPDKIFNLRGPINQGTAEVTEFKRLRQSQPASLTASTKRFTSELKTLGEKKQVITKELLQGGLLRQCGFLMPLNYPDFDLIIPVCFPDVARPGKPIYSFIPVQVKLPNQAIAPIDIKSHYYQIDALAKEEHDIIVSNQLSMYISFGSPNTWKPEVSTPNSSTPSLVEIRHSNNSVMMELTDGMNGFKAHPLFSRVIPTIKDILAFEPSYFSFPAIHESDVINLRKYTKYVLQQAPLKFFQDDNFIRRERLQIDLPKEESWENREILVDGKPDIDRLAAKFNDDADDRFISWESSVMIYHDTEISIHYASRSHYNSDR